MAGETARLFVAVWPPTPVLDALEALPRPAADGIRYTTRDQWHVTLRFLGVAPVDDAVAALDALDATATVAAVAPRTSRLGRSFVVLSVSGLDDLAARVAAATGTVGEPLEDRAFHGHLTIARLRRGGRAVTARLDPLTFDVDDVHLVRSNLHPDGARYETIAVKRLGR